MDYSREMNSLDTSKDSKHSFLLNIRAFNIFKTRASSHFSFWLTEASLKQMQLLQPQRSGILRGNYLATGHEYNTDAVSRRLTVKLAFSPLAVHSLPRPLIRHLSRLHHSHAPASFSAGLSAFSTGTCPPHSHAVRNQTSKDVTHVSLWWCGQQCGICSNAFIRAIKTLHVGDVARTQISAVCASDIDLSASGWVWRDNKDKLSGISV